jgi:hypothetical protein
MGPLALALVDRTGRRPHAVAETSKINAILVATSSEGLRRPDSSIFRYRGVI